MHEESDGLFTLSGRRRIGPDDGTMRQRGSRRSQGWPPPPRRFGEVEKKAVGVLIVVLGTDLLVDHVALVVGPEHPIPYRKNEPEVLVFVLGQRGVMDTMPHRRIQRVAAEPAPPPREHRMGEARMDAKHDQNEQRLAHRATQEVDQNDGAEGRGHAVQRVSACLCDRVELRGRVVMFVKLPPPAEGMAATVHPIAYEIEGDDEHDALQDRVLDLGQHMEARILHRELVAEGRKAERCDRDDERLEAEDSDQKPDDVGARGLCRVQQPVETALGVAQDNDLRGDDQSHPRQDRERIDGKRGLGDGQQPPGYQTCGALTPACAVADADYRDAHEFESTAFFWRHRPLRPLPIGLCRGPEKEDSTPYTTWTAASPHGCAQVSIWMVA